MATVNYLYRSVKPVAFLNLRLLFRNNGEDIVIGGKTRFQVSKDYWPKHDKPKPRENIEITNTRNELNPKLTDLSRFILDKFDSTPIDDVNKKWLSTIVEEYYDPPKKIKIPEELIKFFDFYLDEKKADLGESRKKRIVVVRNKLVGFEKHIRSTLHIRDVDESFRARFAEYCTNLNYSRNTQQSELSIIKTVCFYARRKGLETSLELDGLRLKGEESYHVYLNFEELEKIKNLELTNESLDNARDWLLISCFSGQRVSDFMRFTSDMIQVENGKYFLDFQQVKTKKLVRIPVAKEVREVLEKRNGEFPRAISHQKYNDRIKEVCRLAGINEKVKGKKIICIAPEGEKPTKNDFRRETGIFEKWELISSHVGRRSFASNYYGRIPTTYLIGVTQHSTEAQFLKYIRKSNKDLAADAYDYFQ